MKSFIGIYNQPFIETITVKIKANSETDAEEKFMRYLRRKEIPNYRIDSTELLIIDSDNLEMIIE